MKKKTIFSTIFYLLFIILFTYKSSYFIENPRIWAEEGSVYFRDSYLNGIKSILSFHQGYFSIIPNTTLYLASLFSFKYIPYFTVTLSLLFWYILYFLIININSKKFYSPLKEFLFLGIFFLSNYYQEIFLNTINLQFITPIILSIICLYDFNKLSKRSLYLINAIAFVCVFNGILSFVIIPFYLYKLIKINQKFTAYIILFLYIIINIIAIFQANHISNELSVFSRIKNSIIYKYYTLIKVRRFKEFLINNSYFLMLFPILYFYYTKYIKKFILVLSVFILSIFIDLTVLDPPIHSRYSAILLMYFFIILFLILKKNGKIIITFSITLLIIILCSPSFFNHDLSNDSLTKSWKEEYKNLEKNKKANIHPWNLKIELK